MTSQQDFVAVRDLIKYAYSFLQEMDIPTKQRNDICKVYGVRDTTGHTCDLTRGEVYDIGTVTIVSLSGLSIVEHYFIHDGKLYRLVDRSTQKGLHEVRNWMTPSKPQVLHDCVRAFFEKVHSNRPEPS